MSELAVDLDVYPLEVVMRACHTLTGRAHVFVRASADGKAIVEIAAFNDAADLTGEFANALMDARLRVLIAEETKTVRELLVAQAFCEADLLDRREIESDEYDDPRGIAR